MDLGIIEAVLTVIIAILTYLTWQVKRDMSKERGKRESERAEDKRKNDEQSQKHERELKRLHSQQVADRDKANQSAQLIDALREESRMGERMATAIDNLTHANQVSADRLNGTLVDLGEIMAQNTEATQAVTRTLETVSQTVSQTNDGVKELSGQIDTIHTNIMQALEGIADGHSLQSANIVEALTNTKNELVAMRKSIDRLIPPTPPKVLKQPEPLGTKGKPALKDEPKEKGAA